ncbi:AAA family ATPase [Lamprobacter modestohalophilus]|uniref:AAA family ATPase n=1 Tax=Lamprobacter modestohalophilus TaxID=1064514 RepID=A0A9X1B473_9GAMM|nr:ATP-binding protein [Lamprobacter modestohalophilus]MBK1618466.1 AAA family ATPase [Lamprobacter modestohalophilus]
MPSRTRVQRPSTSTASARPQSPAQGAGRLTFWRTDFTDIPAAPRRLARLAVELRALLGADRSGFSRRVESAALLSLLLPLLEPTALANWAAVHEDDLEPETLAAFTADALAADSLELDETDGHRLLRSLFAKRTTALQARLRSADGTTPVSPTVQLLAEVLSLDAIEAQLLDYLDHHARSEPLRTLLRCSARATSPINRSRLSRLLAIPEPTLAEVLKTNAPLRRLGLLDYEPEADLEDFLSASDLLKSVLDAAPTSREALLALLIEPAPAADWTLADFPHLASESGAIAETLAQALSSRSEGVNALLYGPPGTGKTEFARALAADQGLALYQVRSSDEDGDGLNRRGRLSAYLLGQRLLERRTDAVLLFDEVEDAFESSDNLLALLRGQRTGQQKGWMNRILEENAVPAIWITNDAEAMDPAFLRRFLLPLGFRSPPRSVRRQMAERQLGHLGVSPQLLDDLAADAALTPAQFGAARRLVTLRTAADPDAVTRAGISAQRRLLQGAPVARRRTPATRFDPAFLNLEGELSPAQLLQALERRGQGNLCFYGPPGTGKTQFAEVLAEALDRELIVRQASELVSAYVGETEQNLARLFQDADPLHSVLLLDEVDSFLTDRSQARHSWERTQVNELLQQMERYPGIFIAATNRMRSLDQAALRRFEIKLQFRPLNRQQRRALFAREVFGDTETEVPALIARHLDALEQLTAGDVATVCRQRALLGEDLGPEQFLRRLVVECRLKATGQVEAA